MLKASLLVSINSSDVKGLTIGQYKTVVMLNASLLASIITLTVVRLNATVLVSINSSEAQS